MRMAIGEEKEQSLHLHAAAIFKQLLQPTRAQIGQPFHQHIGLMEAFVLGQFVEQLEDGALRRGKRQRPIPLAPWLHDETVIAIRWSSLSGFQSRPGEAWRDGFFPKQLSVVVVDEARAEPKVIQPSRWPFRAIEMHLFGLAREVMGIALQFERGAAADDERLSK